MQIAQLDNPKAKLSDIIKSHQIKYICAATSSKYYWLSINFDVIDNKIKNKFKTTKIDEDVLVNILVT